MTTAIASGAVSATDARAIVEDIGTQLGDTSFALRANAQIESMIGINGEDLAKDPIGVRLKILGDTQSQLAVLSDGVEGFGKDMGQIFTQNLMNFDTPLATLNSLGNLVSPAALITNSIIGGVQQMQELGTQTAAFAANVTIAAQQGQEMLDSLQIEYEQRIGIATAAGDLAEATRLQGEYELGKQKILAQNAETLKSASTAYSEMESNAQTGVIGSIDQQIKDLYAEGPLAALAQQSISQIGSLTQNGGQTEFVLKTTLSSGDVDPETMNSVLALLGKEQIDVAANIITQFGGAEADRIFQLSKLVDNPEIATSLVVGMQGMTPEEASKTLNTFEEIGKLSGQNGINGIVNIAVNDNGELDLTKLNEITNQIKGLEAEFNAGPVSAKRVREYIFQTTGLTMTQDAENYYNSLPPDAQRLYTSTYLTVSKSINANSPEGMKQLRDWAGGDIRKYMKSGPGSTKRIDYNALGSAYAADQARQQAQAQQQAAANVSGNNDDGGGGGGGGSSAPQKTAQEIELENMNDQLSKHQKALTILSFQEDEINKKYEKRKEALREIAEINAQISEEQRGQLDLAGALASGDIAAAARAAQDMRSKAADNAVKGQEKALEEAQKRELAAVTFDGQTRAQREAQIKDFEKKIADLEYRMPKKEESSSGGGGGGGGGGGVTTPPPATPPPVTKPTTGPYSITGAPGKPIEVKKGWPQTEGWWQSLMAMGSLVADGLSVIANWWNTEGPGKYINEWMAAFGEWWDTWVAQPVKGFIDSIANWWNEGPGAFFNTVFTTIGTLWDTYISKPIQGFFDWFFGPSSVEQKKKDIANFIGSIGSFFKGVFDNIGNWIGEIPKFFQDAVNNAISFLRQIGDWFGGLPGIIGNAIGGLANNIGNGIKGILNGLFDMMRGVNIAGWKPFGGLPRLATGGPITGPGGPTSDSIPAMLSSGEYVVRASSVSKVGLPFLEAINNGEMPDLKGTKISIPGIKYNGKTPGLSKGESAQESSGSVYNYSIVVNAETNANPDQIASAVMTKIKQVEGQRVRGVIR